MNQTSKKIDELFNLDVNDLFLEIAIAESNSDKKIGLTSDDAKKLIVQGYRTFLEAKDRFKKEICSSEQIQQFIQDESHFNKFQIIAGIADFLMSTYNIVTAYSIAVLIFKEGIIDFCKI